MTLINNLIYFILKNSPKRIVKIFSKRYVAGFIFSETLEICKKLNKEGFYLTLDILGEHTKTEKESNLITNQYKNLLKSIKEHNINANISIKPSHIGYDLDIELFHQNALAIIKTAEEYSNFVRIDMESSKLTDSTILFYKKFYKKYSNFGIVLQSYLYRTFEDLKGIDPEKLNFRLCKGIYREPNNISYQNHNDINKNYLKILEYALSNKIYIAIATHNNFLLEESYKLIKKYNADKNQFEFQALYGVPLNKWYKKHFDNNYKVRLYMPFGDDWLKYSLRRIKENPSIAKYVLKNLFKK